MNTLEIILLAISVSMDAFAVSICKGTTINTNFKNNAIKIGVWFGSFQGLMPLMGFFIMSSIGKYFIGIKEYLIFAMLVYIGIRMIIDSRSKNQFSDSLVIKEMLILSIATSLDALSIGMTLSLLKANIYVSVLVISIITFIFCYFGVRLGAKLKLRYKSVAEIFGGIILVLFGCKVLIEYLFFT